MYGEEHYAKPYLTEKFGGSLQGNVVPGFSKLYSLVIASNVIGSTFTLLLLGTRVSVAREKYGVKSPIMYSTDTDEKSDGFKFNSIQRGHQQALETYPSYLALALLSGLSYPLTTALEGILWIVARFAWANGYAVGPSVRYTHSRFGRYVWTPLIHCALINLVVGVKQFL
jgi:glutathione S-transferase